MYVCMLCLSITGLRLKYTNLRIVYIPSGMPLLVRLGSRYDGRLRGETMTPGQRIPENASRGTEDRRLSEKDDSTIVKGEDLCASSKAIHFAR